MTIKIKDIRNDGRLYEIETFYKSYPMNDASIKLPIRNFLDLYMYKENIEQYFYLLTDSNIKTLIYILDNELYFEQQYYQTMMDEYIEKIEEVLERLKDEDKIRFKNTIKITADQVYDKRVGDCVNKKVRKI